MGKRLLKEISNITYGYAFDSKRFSLDSSAGLPVIRIRDLKQGKSNTYTDEQCDDKYHIYNGDLLIGMDGEFNIVEWHGGHALLNQRVCKIESCTDELLQSFLSYSLSGELKHIESQTSYVTVKHLSAKVLNNITLSLPSLIEQRNIINVLTTVNNEITLAKQMLAKADELIQSRFVEMFEQDKQIKHVRLDHISLVGSSHRVFKSEILTSGVPFYRGSEISSLSRGDSASASLFISYEHYEELISQSGKPEIGDLLLPSICDKGQIWRVNTNDPFYFKDGRVLWIRPDKTIVNSEYLKRAICSVLYKDFIKLTSGTTFAELKIFILKGIEVPLPPLALQNEFAEFVAQVESLKATTRQQLDRLNTLYDSLAQRYFAE